ncbi:Transcription factor [Penicillium griseofulvum]|uniref:Transcription factor n=1 Tax=Penicillium patulum TaxID=5078 RepID=A0A135LJ87_PENPA|nr:Transcription factor [Penicillium griseofulvum]KXG49009.1 Transcription factor [Penicillium griseofulvum]
MRVRIAELEWQLGKQLGNQDPSTMSKTPPKAEHHKSGSNTGSTTPSIVPVPLEDHDHTSHPLNAPTLQTITPARSSASSIIFPTSNDAAATTSATITATMPTFLTAEQDTSLPALMDWQDIEMNDGMLADMGNMLQFDLETASPVRFLGGFKVTNLVLADLDQLYFDRLHDVLPMIHRRRYFSWTDQEKPSPARTCLRSAMHTVAAAMSAQYHTLGDALYQETCQLLDSQCMRTLSGDGSWFASTNNNPGPKPSIAGDKIPIELIQSWLLLAYYDVVRSGEHQAMLTAGRAFRLVQLARLYDVDENGGVEDMSSSPAGPDGDQSDQNIPYIIAEEKRRTFWIAFSFDRFLCSRNEWPLTLQEEAVRTRLPASEASFQNNQPTRVCFLSEAIAMSTSPQCYSSTMIPLSPFAECIVLAALHGRCMTHRRMSMLNTGTDEAQEFWTRHDQLTLAVEKRAQILAQSPSLKLVTRDPMVLFTHMLAQKSVIYLSGTLEMALLQRQQQQVGDRQLFASSYKWRAERAAVEIVGLAESARSLGCFSMHPFVADPLAYAANFFIRRAQSTNTRGSGSARSNSSSTSSINSSSNSSMSNNEGEVEKLLCLLRQLGHLNVLAQDYLCTVEAEYNRWCAGRQQEQ